MCVCLRKQIIDIMSGILSRNTSRVLTQFLTCKHQLISVHKRKSDNRGLQYDFLSLADCLKICVRENNMGHFSLSPVTFKVSLGSLARTPTHSHCTTETAQRRRTERLQLFWALVQIFMSNSMNVKYAFAEKRPMLS